MEPHGVSTSPIVADQVPAVFPHLGASHRRWTLASPHVLARGVPGTATLGSSACGQSVGEPLPEHELGADGPCASTGAGAGRLPSTGAVQLYREWIQ